VGLGLDHERGHLLRAALEGVAFALREGLEALEEAGIKVPEPRLAGGGTLRKPWRRLLADVLGRPLRPLPGEAVGSAASQYSPGLPLPRHPHTVATEDQPLQMAWSKFFAERSSRRAGARGTVPCRSDVWTGDGAVMKYV
jgi:hypothetical protein